MPIFKSVHTNTHTTLLIKDGFQLEWVTLALAASTVWAILMFWFQKEEKTLSKQEKGRADVVPNSTYNKRYTLSAYTAL